MGSLTSYQTDIAGTQSGAIKPQDQTSPIEAILSGADVGLRALDSKRYNDSIDARVDKEQGLNAIARGTFQTDVVADANVPRAAKDAVGRLNNAKNAVDQGNLPPVAYTLQLQNQTAQVMVAHPEAAYSIMEYMKASGHNAAMFPALEAQQASQKALQTGYDQSLAYGVDFAQKNGVNPNLPLQDQAKYGLDLSFARDQQQQAILQATAARNNAALSETQRKDAMKEAGVQGVSAVQTEANVRVNSIFDSVRNQIAGIGDTAERETIVQTRLLPALDNVAAQAKASAYNHLVKLGFATEENVKAVYTGIDSQVAGVRAVFADKTGGLQKTLENLKTQYGIDTAKAAPLIYKYAQAVGNNNVAALLGPTTMMDPKLATALGNEWKGIATSGAIDAQTHFNNIVSILNGNTQLHDYTEAEAASYVGAIATGKKASEASILADTSGGKDHQVYLNSTSNLLNATHQLSPASSLKSLTQAANLVATQGSRLALDKLATDPVAGEYAASVGLASHLTSMKLLQDFQQTGQTDSTNMNGVKLQSIDYDSKSGTFYVKFDKDAFMAIPENKAPSTLPSQVAARLATYSRVPTGLQEQIRAMNQVLDHATKTSKYDSDVPKTASPLEIRNAIATGRPFVTKEKSAESKWSTSEQAIEDKLAAFPSIIQHQDALRDSQSSTGNLAPEAKPVNNPGNLRASPTSFQQFGSVEEGIKAADNNLAIYGTKYGISTLADVIKRWAPKSDNNDTEGYIRDAVNSTGYDADEKVNLTDPHTRAVILSAIFHREGTPIPVGRISKVTR